MIEGHIGSPTQFLLLRKKPVFVACCGIPVIDTLVTLQQWLDAHLKIHPRTGHEDP
jgi:hypothetical protein